MSRSRKPLLAVSGAVLVAGMLVPASALAAGESFKGLVLTGICPGQVGDLKSVVSVPRANSVWAPLPLQSPESVSTRKSLHPYQIEVTGQGLKTRHLLPGQVLTKPGPPPAQPVTCVLEGATKEDGPFTVTITGSVTGR